MSKKFVIGDRTKDEWISVLDTEKKKLEFTNHLASAKEYILEEDAQQNLQKIQETGYFSDLQIYMKEDNKAYKVDERDTFFFSLFHTEGFPLHLSIECPLAQARMT